MSIPLNIIKLSPSIIRPHLEQLSESPLVSRLARGAFWSLFGAIISKTLLLASNIIVARMLGKESFGRLAVIQSTVGMFGVFAGFGLGLTATKYIAEFRRKDPAKAGRILALSAVIALCAGVTMALALVVASPWLAEATLADPELSELLRVGAILLFLTALNGAQSGALAGFEAFKAIARINLIAGLASFPIMLGGVYFGELHGAVWALVAIMGVNWLLNHIAIRSEASKARISLTFHGCCREAALLLSFSLPAVLSGAMVGPVQWACTALIVNEPNGYAEIGTYNAALVFYPILLFLGNTVGMPLLSMTSNEKEAPNETLGKLNMLLTWGLSLIPGLVLLAFPEIAQIAFGQQYKDISFLHTFLLVILFSTIVTYKQGLARVLAVNNLLWWGFLSNTMWGFVALVCIYFWADYGATGLAGSYSFAYILNVIVFIPFYTKKGLVPYKTIVSAEAGTIWFVIFALLLVSWFEFSIAFRALCFSLGLAIVSLAFTRLSGVKPFASAIFDFRA